MESLHAVFNRGASKLRKSSCPVIPSVFPNFALQESSSERLSSDEPARLCQQIRGGDCRKRGGAEHRFVLRAHCRRERSDLPGARGQRQPRRRSGCDCVEMAAVCDLWTVNREKAAAKNAGYHGRAPRAVQRVEQLLAMKDIDGVLISTPEHSHSPILKLVTEAGKDAYVEKPMGNVLSEAKAARDAVLQGKTVVQVGTQHRSEPYQQAAQAVARGGSLGDVSKVEIVWNYHGPRWRGRPQVKQIREQDTDWSAWPMTKPPRPFDPQRYFEFRLYREFSSGIPDQWMSHAIDLVHWFMDDHFPVSAVSNGGVFAWHDGRENADTFQTLLEYPKQFMVSYSTSFGNDAPSFTRYMGKKATLINLGGEGSPRYQLVEEKGTHEDDSNVDEKRKSEYISLPGENGL